MAVPLNRETYLPDDGDQIARVYDFLSAHESAGRETSEPRYFLAGAGVGEQIELPR